jgi:RNA polymerase sigma-70 factor, ECF subfamily
VSLEEPANRETGAPKREHGKVDERLSTSIDRIALTRAMKELPVGYRTIFLLHEVKGYEHHEIARLLRCSVGNSKSQLHKAKARMRELLGLQRAEASRSAGQKTAVALETLAAADAISRLQPVEAQTWESASEAAA